MVTPQNLECVQNLINEYCKGNKEVEVKIANKIAEYSYEKLKEIVANIDRQAVETLVKQRVIELINKGYTEAKNLYRYTHLSVYDNFIKWGVIKPKRSDSLRARVPLDVEPDNMLNEMNFRLQVMEKTKVTKTQWEYHKLLRQLEQTGNKDLFAERLYNLVFDNVLDYAQKNTKNTILSEEELFDAVSDVVIRKIRNYLKVDKLPEAYYMWMVALKNALNQHIVALEFQKNQKLKEIKNANFEIVSLSDIKDEIANDDPIRLVLNEELKKELNIIIDNVLTEKQAQALRLLYFEKFSYYEIAEIMGVGHKRVRELEKISLHKLRQELKKSKHNFNI